MYALYTQALRAVLPCLQKNILINQRFPSQLVYPIVIVLMQLTGRCVLKFYCVTIPKNSLTQSELAHNVLFTVA